MTNIVKIDDKELVEETLRRIKAGDETVPETDVRKFLDKVGAHIERSGQIRQEDMDELLRQLHNGEI